MEPVLRWPGAKWRIAPWVVKQTSDTGTEFISKRELEQK